MIAGPMWVLVCIVVTLLSIAATSCGDSGQPPQARPRGVPKEAIWAGGLDGGSYISCTVDLVRNVNFCRVWNDYSGDIVEHGEYRLRRAGRAASKSELRFEWADRGGWIGLRDGLVLENLGFRHRRQEQP